MVSSRGLLTLDANVFVAALKSDETYTAACRRVLKRLADGYVLVEPSIVYVEVLGVLARRIGLELAEKAREELDEMLDPRFTVSCDREFCLRAYSLCRRYGIYAVDSLYLEAAIEAESTLVSLDGEDFVEKIRAGGSPVNVLHVSEFIK